nr:IAA-amino acid hydrolase ILR1-like 5 [Tanacetum cinerariifolium]
VTDMASIVSEVVFETAVVKVEVAPLDRHETVRIHEGSVDMKEDEFPQHLATITDETLNKHVNHVGLTADQLRSHASATATMFGAAELHGNTEARP